MQLYIPKKLKIGFQERKDSFDGKLSFITYYDNNGKISNETRWSRWCDGSISNLEIDNIPFKNATLNKNISHAGYRYGTGRTAIRIYDSRGFEYEIDIDNFMGIAQEYSVVKGEITGEFVYAFANNKVILLPVDSEQYKDAIKTTLNRNEKVDESSLTPGDVYLNDKEEECIYIGFYNMNKSIAKYLNILVNKQKPSHVFYNNNKDIYEFIKIEKLGLKKDTLLPNEFEVYFNNYVGTIHEKEIEEIYIEKDFDIEKIQKNKNLKNMLFGYDQINNGNRIYYYTKIVFGKIYNCYRDTDKEKGSYLYHPQTLIMNYLKCCNKRYTQVNDFLKLFNDHSQSKNNSEQFCLSENSDAFKLLNYRFYNKEGYYFKSKEEGQLFIDKEYEPILREWKRNGMGLLMYRFKDGTMSPVLDKDSRFHL